ncbi:GNAT family N-acetyltransferase [Aspergillus melleus]|uniref:GNAT family N-acetyltransferase n=1 Tax=Aspergillus melleus TaxID=138277 RepID=UPI001E8D493D|nr:uncharacterized protein LDX57_011144 [Aspergillus melleus]KAH8433510.1 hypothetical protein LDX57_011144 [Aspergillus melleus]
MSFPPSFHTARLTFVPMNADLHAAAIFETRGCEHVMKYSINHAPDPSVAETHAWASKYNHFDGPPTSININDNISPIGYVIQERLPVPASSSSPLNNTISDTTTTTKQAKTDVKFGPPQNQDRIIGMTGLGLNTSPLTPNSPERRWELGYGFHPSAWGRGIATEVVRGWIRAVGEEGLLGFAFSSSSSSSSNTGSASGSGSTSGSPSTGTDTVSDSVNGSTAEGKMKIKPVLAACTDARNEASMRVLEKCGFVRTGEFLDSEGRGNFEFEYRF